MDKMEIDPVPPPLEDTREEDDERAEDEADWGGWVEENDAAASAPCPCPVSCGCPPLAGAAAALKHAAEAHGVDLLAVRTLLRLDTLGWARLVNYARREKALPRPLTREHALFADDSLLVPVLADDPLLMMPHEEDFSDDEDEEDGPKAEIERLRRENEDLRRVAMRALLGADDADKKADSDAPAAASGEEKVDTQSDYFASYERLCIHEEMLRDEARTGAYYEFFQRASNALIKGHVVADVGAGTGVLSVMAAKAGAAHVYAIEASAAADLARRVIADNGVSSIVELVRGAAEEVSIPVRADVIVSEWMGYCLLFENMLESVIAFRDKFLAPGGCVQPSHAIMWASAIERDKSAHEDRVGFFEKNDYGIDFRSIRPMAFAEAATEIIDPDELVGEPCMLIELDINKLKRGEAHKLSFKFEQRVARRLRGVHGLAIWFDCEFRWREQGAAEDSAVVLSTSPGSEPTHWKQCITAFDDALGPCEPGDVLEGSLAINRAGERGLEIDVFICNQKNREASIHRSFHV